MEVAVVNQVRLKIWKLRRGRASGTSDELVAAKDGCRHEQRRRPRMAAGTSKEGGQGWLPAETRDGAMTSRHTGQKEGGGHGWLPPSFLWGVDGFLVRRDVDLVGLRGGQRTAVEVEVELDGAVGELNYGEIGARLLDDGERVGDG